MGYRITITSANAVAVGSLTSGTYSKPSGGIPKTDLASAVQTSLEKADTALQTAPVTSVNGQTGAVSLSIPNVDPDTKTAIMTQSVGVDSNGKLWSKGYEPFLVNLTPTALDFSGTMDKTVAEIYEAYQAGRQIMFRLMMGNGAYMEVDCSARWVDGTSTYPSFNAVIVDDGNNLIYAAYTSTTTDGTKATYGIKAYNLNNIPAPSNPSQGDVLTYDGGAWDAAALPTYNGGVS